MNPTTKLLFFFVDLIVPAAIGYTLRRRGWTDSRIFDRLIMFGIVVIDPILVGLSFWNLELEASLIWIPLLAIVMTIIPGALAIPRARTKYADSLTRGGFVLSAMLSNRGVVGMLTVFVIYGEPGYALVALFMLASPFLLYMISYPLAERYYQDRGEATARRITLVSLIFTWKQIPLLGLIAGAFLNLTNVPRAPVFGDIFPYLVHLNAWIFVIPVGHALNFHEMTSRWRGSLDLLWIKFILTPVLTYLLLQLLDLDPLAENVLLILSFAPTAINAVVTARLFRLDVHITGTAFVLTTVTYLGVVLPLLLWWFG